MHSIRANIHSRLAALPLIATGSVYLFVKSGLLTAFANCMGALGWSLYPWPRREPVRKEAGRWHQNRFI